MTTTIDSPACLVNKSVRITVGNVILDGELKIPENAPGVVLFAHGSGSSRRSPRNQFVAGVIREAGIGTLLFDLLTQDEERQDAESGALRFDIALLAKRLVGATRWLEKQPETRDLKVGYFGASTGGGAAIVAAAELGDRIAAVVSRGGRPDLAGDALQNVNSPTLLIVGGYDEMVICLNDDAYSKLRCEKDFRIVPGATHLFEEPGKLEQVARISAAWFRKHLGRANGETRDHG
jgi:putative phosphoribosyl transferase